MKNPVISSEFQLYPVISSTTEVMNLYGSVWICPVVDLRLEPICHGSSAPVACVDLAESRVLGNIITAASVGWPKWRNWRQKNVEKLEPLGMPWAMPQGCGEQALSAHHPTDVKNGWGRSKETLHLWNHLLRHFRTTVTQNLCCSRGIDLQTVLYDQIWRFVKSRDSWKTLMPQAHPLVSLILSARCIDWETSNQNSPANQLGLFHWHYLCTICALSVPCLCTICVHCYQYWTSHWLHCPSRPAPPRSGHRCLAQVPLLWRPPEAPVRRLPRQNESMSCLANGKRSNGNWQFL